MNAKQSTLRDLLAPFGIPESVLAAWEAEGITDLLPIQRQAITSNIFDGHNYLIFGPTSCGKTFIGELACVKHARDLKPCLYLVPFRALAEEKFSEFTQKYGRDGIGAKVVISTSDRRIFDRDIIKLDFDIAILTYEKLAAIIVQHPGLLKAAGVLVVDEIQMISDDGRGAGIELLLTRARQIAPTLQIIGLSAVVSDVNGFDEWMDAKVVSDDHRPVPLREGVIIPDGTFRFVEWSGSERAESSETLHQITGATQPELAVSLAAELLKESDEQIILFADTVRGTKLLAENLAAKVRDLPRASKALDALVQLEDSESVVGLKRTLERAVAFHNADLTFDERRAVEQGFRNGEIRCVVSTSTLSMGVNMPASTVILSAHTKWSRGTHGGLERVPLTVAEYRNMSGRAGRFGLRKDNFGRALLTAVSPIQQDGLVNSYVNGVTGPLQSAFLKRPLNGLILQTFATGLCNSADGCFRFLLRTFAARSEWATESTQKSLETKVQSIVQDPIKNELLIVDDKGDIVATDLGRVCAASGLSVDTFKSVTGYVRSSNISAADIALIASRGEETGPDAVTLSGLSTDEYNLRTPHFVQTLRDAISSERSPMTESLLDSYLRMPPYEEARPLKFQCVALAFVRGIATHQIENSFAVSAGKMRSIGSMCMWVCDTAAKVAWTIGHPEEAKAYEVLADRFEFGCSEDALLLAHVPHRLHRAERERLVSNGFTSLQSIVNAAPLDIAKSAKVDPRRIAELQKGIISVIGESLEIERQQLARLNAISVPVKLVEEVYAMKGTLLEQALENLMQPPCFKLKVSRITSQREGEADLQIVLSSGRNAIAQVNAKDSPSDRVNLTKSGAVLQQSPELKPAAFICIGRPDFLEDAINKAKEHAANGTNFKLIPVSVLAEMYVRFHEQEITSDRIAEILERETGYISIERL
jgi:replicative superfamily II helicase